MSYSTIPTSDINDSISALKCCSNLSLRGSLEVTEASDPDNACTAYVADLSSLSELGSLEKSLSASSLVVSSAIFIDLSNTGKYISLTALLNACCRFNCDILYYSIHFKHSDEMEILHCSISLGSYLISCFSGFA